MKHLGSIAYIGLLVIAAAVLAGCAGLSVAWVVQASYNTPATTSANMVTGPAKAASAPASAASAAK